MVGRAGFEPATPRSLKDIHISRVLLGLEELCSRSQLTVLSYRPNELSDRDKDAY